MHKLYSLLALGVIGHVGEVKVRGGRSGLVGPAAAQLRKTVCETHAKTRHGTAQKLFSRKKTVGGHLVFGFLAFAKIREFAEMYIA